MQALGFVVVFVGIALGLFVYFFPAWVANRRSHRNVTAITVLNLLLGWTLLGWVAALVWAYTVQPAMAVPSPSLTPSTTADPMWLAGVPARVNVSSKIVSDERECPACAEVIKAKARICKHCGTPIEQPPQQPHQPADPEREAESLGIVYSPLLEAFMWRRQFFKTRDEAVAFAKTNM